MITTMLWWLKWLGPLFLDVKIDSIAPMTEKIKDDDDDGWNDIYNGILMKLMTIMTKSTQILWLLRKKSLILGPITLWKGAKKIQAGAMPESKHSF